MHVPVSQIGEKECMFQLLEYERVVYKCSGNKAHAKK